MAILFNPERRILLPTGAIDRRNKRQKEACIGMPPNRFLLDDMRFLIMMEVLQVIGFLPDGR